MNCFRTDGKRQERWLLPFSEKLHHATLCEVRQKKELAAWKIVLVAQWNEIWYTGKTRKGECFMRKLTALLLALITSLSLAACSFVALPMDPEQPTNQKQEQLAEDGTYTTKEDVARYIHLYGRSVTSTPWAPSPGDRSGSSFPTMGGFITPATTTRPLNCCMEENEHAGIFERKRHYQPRAAA